jgi:hypothetical protein
MACDCLSALRNIFDHRFDKPSQPHYDLLHSCRLLIAHSPAIWYSRHVCGHLDRWEQLNVDMDTLAKRRWQTVAHTNRPQFDLPQTTEWSVWHRNRRLTSWSDKVALQLIHTKPAQNYWTKTQCIPHTTQPPAWDALNQATPTQVIDPQMAISLAANREKPRTLENHRDRCMPTVRRTRKASASRHPLPTG